MPDGIPRGYQRTDRDRKRRFLPRVYKDSVSKCCTTVPFGAVWKRQGKPIVSMEKPWNRSQKPWLKATFSRWNKSFRVWASECYFRIKSISSYLARSSLPRNNIRFWCYIEKSWFSDSSDIREVINSSDRHLKSEKIFSRVSTVSAEINSSTFQQNKILLEAPTRCF